MIDKMRIGVSSMILTSVLCFCGSSLSSQHKASLDAFSGEALDVYLDRADVQASPEEWQRYADMGREAAIARWEESALYSLASADFEAERSAALEGIRALTDDRYREWLVARFTERAAPSELGPLRAAIASANEELLYQRDSNGNVVRDAMGDPVLETLVGLEADSGAWASKVGTALDSIVAAWRTSFEGSFPELLASVPETERKALESDTAAYAEEYGSAYRRELAALSFQEERRFVALRSFDQYSQRKKSEDQAAGAIVDRLIAQTQGATDEGVRRLRESLSTQAGAGPAEGQIDASEWQSSFQRIFEEGLSTWDKAERQLLAERVEWENQAGKDYTDGEKAWATAYDRLEGEQQKWEAELQTIVDIGHEAWAGKEAELAGAIAEASAELDKDIQDRKDAKSSEAASLVDVFAQSASMVATAKESIAYWLKDLGFVAPQGTQPAAAIGVWSSGKLSGYIATLSGLAAAADADADKYSQAAGQLQSDADAAASAAAAQRAIAATYKDGADRLIALRDSLAGRELSADELAYLKAALDLCGSAGDYAAWQSSYQEAAYWIDVDATYTRFNSEARTALTATFSRVIADDGVAKSLLGITDSSVDVSSLCLDEYQVELLKAEALSTYWDQQVDVASKVYAYATTISSDRPTAAQTDAECKAALDAYSAARDTYDAALKDLERTGVALGSAKDALAARQASLTQAKAALESAETQYETAQALFSSNDKDYFAQELTGYYKSLLETIDASKAGSLAASMASYLAAARSYGYEDKIALDSKELEVLVVGGEQGGVRQTESLESLRASLAAISPPTDEGGLQSSGIDPADRFYAAYQQAAYEYGQAIASSDAADAAMYLRACISIDAQCRAERQAALDEREDAIRILTSSSPTAWYRVETGIAAADYADVVAAVALDAREAAGNYLAARADLEASAYGDSDRVIVAGSAWVYDPTHPEEFLAFSLAGAVADAAAKRTALLDLAAFLRDGHLDLAASRDALYASIASCPCDDSIKEFLRGFVGGKTEFYSTLGSDSGSAVGAHGASS